MYSKKQMIEDMQVDGVSKTDTEAMLDGLLDGITQSLSDGETVKLGSIGTIRVTMAAARKERQGRNPRTGEALTISAKPAYRDIKIKNSKAMFTVLNPSL